MVETPCMPNASINAFVEARLPAWQALFQALVAQRSVFEAEHGIVDLVAAHIGKMGLDVIRVPHTSAALAALPGSQRPFSDTEGRTSLVTRVAGSGTGPSLAFNTHLDIVPEGNRNAWSHPPFAGEIDEQRGVLYGRGAMDDKAGVTIALAVLETLVHYPVRLRGNVVFQFVLEDETTGNGSLLCLNAAPRPDAVVIIDGTRPNRAINGHAGQLAFGIHVHGRPASVSVSHLGVNAADRAARLVVRLADAVGALNVTRSDVWTRFPSPFQLITQHLQADGAPLTVPEYAEAVCYMTFPPPWTLERARGFLRDEIDAFAREHDLCPAPEIDFDRFSAEPVTSEAARLAAALQVCASEEGYDAIDIGPSTGTSDLRHFAAAGIPCLLYGPGSGFNPHRPDEHYYLADLPRMIRLFANLASRWCGAL
jgi:acetylornithine deacetylase